MQKLFLFVVCYIFTQIVSAQDTDDNLILSNNNYQSICNRHVHNSLRDNRIPLKQKSEHELDFNEVFSYNLDTFWCENHVAAADFDRDSETDIIIFATTTPDTIQPFSYKSKIILLYNDSNWQFTDTVIAEFNDYAYGISVGDFNNDDWEDFAIKVGGNTCVYLNDQSGKFSEVWCGGSGDYRSLDLADLNGDNSLDILSGIQTPTGGLIEVFTNNGTGTDFQQTWQSNLYGSNYGTIYNIFAANLNYDSDKDIVAALDEGSIITFSGDGSGTFFNEEMIKELGSLIFSLATGNINGDTLTDIAVYVGWGEVRIFTTNNVDSLTELWVSPNFSENAYNLALEDFDHDGYSDLFVGTFQTGYLFIYKNQSGSDFTLVWNDTLPGSGYTGKVTYLNNDSFPDLIVGEENDIHLLINTANPVPVELAFNNIPDKYTLLQNYPNPFNPATKIKYQLPNASFVSVKIYDVLGNEIVTLVNEEKTAGSYEIDFNANNLPDGKAGLSSGIYFYKLQAGAFVETKKMVFLK